MVVNKPGAGLDGGRQGSRGSAVVKVRATLRAVLHRRPPLDLAAAPGPSEWRDARPPGPPSLPGLCCCPSGSVYPPAWGCRPFSSSHFSTRNRNTCEKEFSDL